MCRISRVCSGVVGERFGRDESDVGVVTTPDKDRWSVIIDHEGRTGEVTAEFTPSAPLVPGTV